MYEKFDILYDLFIENYQIEFGVYYGPYIRVWNEDEFIAGAPAIWFKYAMTKDGECPPVYSEIYAAGGKRGIASLPISILEQCVLLLNKFNKMKVLL